MVRNSFRSAVIDLSALHFWALTSLLVAALSLSACGSGKPESRGHLVRITQNAESVTAFDDGDEIEALCGEQYCEPNFLYSISFGRSKRKDQVEPPSVAPPAVPYRSGEQVDYAMNTLRVGAAWNFTQGSSDVVVAVIDTGVDYRHPDLAASMWVNQAEANGVPGVDDDGNGYVDDVYGWDFVNNRPNGMDDNGHGTHVAGTIAAANNGSGTVGVAPGVRIMALKFLDSSGSGDTNAAIQAFRYATAMGADVISNSWGGGGKSAYLDEAIQAAQNKGILVTAAAGNERSNNDVAPSFPAGYGGVIAVASSDENDRLSVFSNYGKSVAVAAPGSNIFSTLLGGGYTVMSGTSMATPHVSGALALARSVSKTMTREKIIDLLCESSYGILKSAVSCGRMDVYEFLRRVKRGG